MYSTIKNHQQKICALSLCDLSLIATNGVPRSAEHCPSYVAWVILFCIGAVMLEISLGFCKNSKPVMYFLPGWSFLKRTFGCRNPEWLDQKLGNKVFLGSHTKTLALKMFSLIFQGYARKTACGPKKLVSGMGWTLGCWFYVGFYDAKLYSHKHWKFNAWFLLGIQKSLLKFSIKPFWMDDPKALSPGWKSWKNACNLIVSYLGQKLS